MSGLDTYNISIPVPQWTTTPWGIAFSASILVALLFGVLICCVQCCRCCGPCRRKCCGWKCARSPCCKRACCNCDDEDEEEDRKLAEEQQRRRERLGARAEEIGVGNIRAKYPPPTGSFSSRDASGGAAIEMTPTTTRPRGLGMRGSHAHTTSSVDATAAAAEGEFALPIAGPYHTEPPAPSRGARLSILSIATPATSYGQRSAGRRGSNGEGGVPAPLAPVEVPAPSSIGWPLPTAMSVFGTPVPSTPASSFPPGTPIPVAPWVGTPTAGRVASRRVSAPLVPAHSASVSGGGAMDPATLQE